MNKTIFIALALTSLFLGTQAAYVNICADANCIACPTNAATACTACAAGYFLNTATGACTSCNGATPAACATCASATACGTAAAGYFLNTATPVQAESCNGANPAGCAVCASLTACGTAAAGYFLNTATPVQAESCNGATPAACATCASLTACGTAAAGYYLNTATPVQAVQCADTFNAATCSAADTATGCNKGTLGSGICCGVANCDTCATSAVAGATGANVVCASCASGYYLTGTPASCAACTAASNCATCPNGPAICSTCPTGYALSGTAGAAGTTCIATTPVPATSSPSSAFNVTPALVYTSTDTTAPAFSAVSGSTYYGPGFDSTTAYVWLTIAPTVATGTYTVNRREVNTTAFTKSNSTADAAITTSIPSTATSLTPRVAPGYFLVGSVTPGLNWGAATATASEVYLTYIPVNGTATTKAITGNTNTNVFYTVKDVFYLNGTAYVVYLMKTRTAGTATTADTFALNGIYIHGVTLSTGTLLNYTTGGVKAISLTQSNTGTIGTTCTVGTTCASEPSSQVSSFSVGLQNFTQNADTVWYLWDDQSTSTAKTIKLGSINVTTGAATSGTTLTTATSASTGAGTAADPTIMTYYSIAGFHGSDSGSFGAYINKRVTSTTPSGTTTTSTVLSFINGTSTAQTTLYSLTPPTGYTSSSVNGFGTEDGFILVQTAYSQAATTPAQPISAQAQRFYTNGTAVTTSAVGLGTYSASPLVYQDTNGTIVLGYTLADTLTSKTYSGYLGSYVVQAMAASTLTSIFAFLSLMIVALFAF